MWRRCLLRCREGVAGYRQGGQKRFSIARPAAAAVIARVVTHQRLSARQLLRENPHLILLLLLLRPELLLLSEERLLVLLLLLARRLRSSLRSRSRRRRRLKVGVLERLVCRASESRVKLEERLEERDGWESEVCEGGQIARICQARQGKGVTDQLAVRAG
jgi:hypothetical protein